MRESLTKKMISSENAATVLSEMKWTSEIPYMEIHMLTHTMTMKWKPCGEVVNMKILECSTLKLLFLITTVRSVNAIATLGSGTVIERGNETIARGRGASEKGSGREKGSARRRGCGGRKNGSGTG